MAFARRTATEISRVFFIIIIINFVFVFGGGMALAFAVEEAAWSITNSNIHLFPPLTHLK